VSKPFHNPFGDLANLTGIRPKEPEPVEAPEAQVPRTAAKPIARAVVRIERSGRGGKEVTVIEQLDLSASQRDDWLKALKAALGCGGTLESSAIVLQGDHRKRLPGILAKRGVRKVTVS
jgi:translation initiation factor 1